MAGRDNILEKIHPRYRAQIEAERARPRVTAWPGAPVITPLPGQSAPEKKRIRQRDRKVSLLEERYGRELRVRNPLDRIHEQFPVALGNGCNYYLDFLVVHAFPIEDRVLHEFSGYEVKGPYSRAAGIAKLKVAATHYPWIKFYLVSEIQGRWVLEALKP